jgi:hypothetical protein
MALFSECSLECASKLLDTADIVREAIFHQLRNTGRGITALAIMTVKCGRSFAFLADGKFSSSLL